MNSFDLSGKRFLITGAASGIGLRTLELLVNAGAKTVALDRKRPEIACDQFIEVDLCDPHSIDNAVSHIEEGTLDGLSNIAGAPGTASVETICIYKSPFTNEKLRC